MTRRNRLVAWPLRHVFGAAVVAVLVALAGFAALGRLPLDYPPASAGARWHVRVSAPAMGQPFLDAQIAQPLTRELAVVPGVMATETSVRAGEVAVELRFASVARRDAAREELTQRLARLQSALPLKYARVEVADRRPVPTQVLELAVGIEGRDAAAVRTWAEETLVPPLAGVPGVAEVALHGAGGREVQVVPDQRRLAGLGLSIADLLETFDNAAREGPLLSLAAVEALPVRLVGGENIQLSEVAQVTEGEATAARRLWFDGRPGLVLSVSRQPQANAAEVGRRIKAQLAWLQANGQIPTGARMDFLADDAGVIGVSLARMATAALTGLALVALLLVLVFRRLRPVLHACCVLLLAGLALLLLLAALRYPLNVMVLGGWVLALGAGAAGSLLLWDTVTRRAPPTASALRQGTILAAVFATASVGLLAPFVLFAEQADTPYGQAALAALIVVVAALLFAWLLAPVFAAGNPVAPQRRHPFIRRWPRVRALAPTAGVLLLVLTAVAFLFLLSRYAVSDEAVRVRVEGPDTTQTVRLGYALLTRLQSVPGLGALQHSAGGAREDVAIVLDTARAAERQVGLADVAQVVGLAVEGRIVGRLVEQGQSSPIRLRLVPEAGDRAEALRRLLLRGETRQRPAVYVRDVAMLQPVTTPATIRYRNGSATAELSGSVLAGYSPDAVCRQVQEALREASLPKDYQARLEMQADDGTDNARYLVALVVGVLLVVSAWAVYYRSWQALARLLPLTLLVFGIAAVCLWFAGPLFTSARALGLGFVFAIVAGQLFLFVDAARESPSPMLVAWLVIAAVTPLAWWGGPLLASARETAATLAAGAAVSALVLQALAPWRQRIGRRERRP